MSVTNMESFGTKTVSCPDETEEQYSTNFAAGKDESSGVFSERMLEESHGRLLSLEDWKEDDTLPGDGTADNDSMDASEEQSYKYDVFISYSQCDRPWVRDVLIDILEDNGKKVCIDYRDFTPGLPIMDNIVQAIEDSKVTILVLTPTFVESEWCKYESRHALGVSLETSQARVLPLILMECEIPSILNHITYLDNTSEDVQPFFTMKLLESLEKAGKWRKVYSGYRAQGIVPVSEIQDVVTRTVNTTKRQEQRRIGRVFRKSHINSKVDSRKCYCFAPLVIIFMGICLTCIVVIAITAVFESSKVQHVGRFFDQTRLILTSNLSSTSCKALNLTDSWNKNKVVADFFLFPSKENLKQHRRETGNRKFLLTEKEYWISYYTIHKGMHFSSKFCLFSNYSASIKLYVAKGSSEIYSFKSVWPDTYLTGRNYRVNMSSVCYNFISFPDHVYSRSAIIFANEYSPPVFVNYSFIVHSTAFKKSKPTYVCRNTSYCRIPHSSSDRQVIINVNITDPDYNGDNIDVICIVEKLYCYLIWGGVFLGNIVLFILVTLFAKRKIFPIFTRCFKEELDWLAELENETLIEH